MLKRPLIYGETPERERQAILGTFRASDALRTICISKVGKFLSFFQISRRVVKELLSYSAKYLYLYLYLILLLLLFYCRSLVTGDTSIDLPEANVIVQVSSHFGSRRQEAQRLGRILRPKSYTQTDGSNKSTFNAFFYTLVSADTQEMYYSAKRQQYLIDQGYTFKIVTNLCEKAAEEAVKHDYAFATPEDDRRILRTVLTSENDLEKVICAPPPPPITFLSRVKKTITIFVNFLCNKIFLT
jgi:DNA excision repair protein ERCC-3